MTIMTALFAHAQALTMAVNTPMRDGHAAGYVQGASNVVYGGAIAAISTNTGMVVPATDTPGLVVVGMIGDTSDNGGINAARYQPTRKVWVNRGIFRWDNGDAVPFGLADIGQMAYIQTDHAVQRAASSAAAIPVGIVVDVDADGVWVDVSSLSRQLSANLAALAVTGNASVGGSLAVQSGVVTLASLPTSTNGLTSGRLWNNSGVLSIKP